MSSTSTTGSESSSSCPRRWCAPPGPCGWARALACRVGVMPTRSAAPAGDQRGQPSARDLCELLQPRLSCAHGTHGMHDMAAPLQAMWAPGVGRGGPRGVQVRNEGQNGASSRGRGCRGPRWSGCRLDVHLRLPPPVARLQGPPSAAEAWVHAGRRGHRVQDGHRTVPQGGGGARDEAGAQLWTVPGGPACHRG